MFENVNIDWNLSHDDGSTDFSDEETLDDHPRTLTRTPDKKVLRPMSIYTPVMNGENDESPENNRSHGSSSDWSRSNTSDSGDSPGSYRNSIMPPPPPPSQSKKPSICKWITASSIPLIRRARSIAFGFIILSCGREGLSLTNVLVSSCTCQDTLPLLSKGGNQGALVLVKLNFQTPSPFIAHFFSCFHLSLFQFDPRPLAFVFLIGAFSSCFSYELFQFQPRTLQLTSLGA